MIFIVDQADSQPYYLQSAGQEVFPGMGGSANQDNHEINSLQLLREANDPICFLKSHAQVELQALRIGKFAVTGKLRAVFGLSPAFTGSQKCFGKALFAVGIRHIDAL